MPPLVDEQTIEVEAPPQTMEEWLHELLDHPDKFQAWFEGGPQLRYGCPIECYVLDGMEGRCTATGESIFVNDVWWIYTPRWARRFIQLIDNAGAGSWRKTDLIRDCLARARREVGV